MSKGKGFFDGAFSAPEGKTPIEPRVIKGVKFFDTPREEEERDPHDSPYIPSEKEWRALKREIRFQANVICFSIFIGAAAFIFAIRALVTK